MKKQTAFIVLILLALFIAPTFADTTSCGTGNATQKQPCKLSFKKLPDLTLTSLEVVQGVGSEEGKMIVLYRVENLGGAPAQKSKIKLSVGGDNPNVVITQITPAMSMNGAYAGRAVYTLNKKGKYVVKATADYNNNLYERNESNNSNAFTFSIGR